MTIWILALVLIASLAGVGWRQGAIRVAFSLIGIFIAALLAGPLSGLIRPLLPHLGLHNPIVIWVLSPFIVFVIVVFLFKSAGFVVHRKVDVYYKYQTDDLRQAWWHRANRSLGLCLGLVNGLVYLALISFVIYDFSYWTIQVAPSNSEARSVRLLNQMGRDLESAGLDKVARAINPMPEIYFKTADLAGLLCQNPQLANRLADYPPFISLGERDDFQQLGQDANFQSAWKSHAPVGQLLNYASAKAIWQNSDTTKMIWDLVTNNLTDLETYLQTGQSAKYTDKILGRWNFNLNTTYAMLRVSNPNVSAADMQALGVWMMTYYTNTTFLAGSDGQAFLNNLPHLNPGRPPTTDVVSWKGTWTADGTNYDLSLTGNGQSKTMSASTDGTWLTIKDDDSLLIFDRGD